ncbi:hypothetical protein [Methylotenera sp.]|uniref:hypothetical protein n=1 Tax=Methylotenera sp. TaxID=2051956 RepID=UPI00273019C8|nr:hypothetical protein [Methylotenera sp.]MDP2072405.1 hypothetical protein [Methylotenera sp.]MDP3005648.1 hypothetical protein [Methylotenera sp.]
MSNTLNISHTHWQWLRNIARIGEKRSNASLYGLSDHIHQWNIARISRNHLHGSAQNLSIENVLDLKTIIQNSLSKATTAQTEVIADQLLFLAIGAIQIESQNGSNEAWRLVNRAIQNIAAPKKEKPALMLSFMAMLLATCTYIAMNTPSKTHIITPALPLAMEVNNSPDPVTISMLELTYNKMKAGTCQLPQAAMLPPAQRHAFLMFVNAGTIDVHHVEDLRQALGYVNCLYPQELMHPTHTYGNTL